MLSQRGSEGQALVDESSFERLRAISMLRFARRDDGQIPTGGVIETAW
jgi:hypothetical protein